MRKLLIGALVLAAAIQLVPVPRSNPPVVVEVEAPADVAAILRRACYDCHSNETVWPWYAYVAPVSWLVAYDVHEGREHLNFSDWAAGHDDRDEIGEEVDEGDMPLWWYSVMRSERRLSRQDVSLLRSWAATAIDHGDDSDHDDHDDHGHHDD